MPVAPEKTRAETSCIFLWDLIPGSNWRVIASGYIGVHNVLQGYPLEGSE